MIHAMTSTHKFAKYLDVSLPLHVAEQIPVKFGDKIQRAVVVLYAGELVPKRRLVLRGKPWK